MIKRYRVFYTWHSGESFDAIDKRFVEVELDEDDVDEWKFDFERDKIDGSYCSIDIMEEIKRK